MGASSTSGEPDGYAALVLRRAVMNNIDSPVESLEDLDALRALLEERSLDLDSVLRQVVDAACELVGADRGTLYLVDPSRGELVSRVAHLPEISEIRLRIGEGIAGWVAQRGELLNVPAGTRDPRFAQRVDAATGYLTRSLLAVPIVSEGEGEGEGEGGGVLAVLQVLNKTGGEVFGAADEAALSEVATAVAACLEASSLASQLRAESSHPLSFRFNHIIGDSAPMRAAYDRVTRAARTQATVLLRGESGSGKELFARAVHDNSTRQRGPCVAVDLGALPPDLVENELFGHVRGAFTGADRDREGKVAAAEGGTLFLDEVGEAPANVQAKLLRLVQDRTYFPVGSATPRKADVRFVCATHRDLEAMVQEGTFRQDLYYRLRVVEIVVPPLRERGHVDLDRLVDHFLYRLSRRHGRPGLKLSGPARGRLHAHPWPGNVRELMHCLESAVVLAPGPAIEAGDLDLPQTRSAPAGAAGLPEDLFVTEVRPLREVEVAYARHVLALCEGNLTESARRLGITRGTLRRKLSEE